MPSWTVLQIYNFPGRKKKALEMSTFEDTKTIQVIELHMMDKRKYFPLALVSGVAVRGFLYPVMLIKTRIQIQKQKAHYYGTF